MIKLRALHTIPAAVTAGDEGWYHIIPIGEHTIVAHDLDGKQHIVTEIVDHIAISRIMAAHTALAADPEWPGYLVAKEHFSQQANGSTEAYAWGLEIQPRMDDPDPRARGLWLRAKKTALGAGAIGSVYKFFSTVNNLEPVDGRQNAYRPIDIEDIGLTNKPAYRTLMPARHSAVAGPSPSVRATPVSPKNKQEEPTAMLEKLKTLLARHKVQLAADAGEDAIVTAIDTAIAAAATVPDLTQRVTKAEHRATTLETADVGALTVRAETAEARVAALEKADLERRADTFVAQHSALIKDPAAVRELYLKSPESADALIAQIKPPADPAAAQRVLHRANATTPDRSPAAAANEADARRDRERNDYVEKLRAEHRLPSRSAAWALASQLRPELFPSRAGGNAGNS